MSEELHTSSPCCSKNKAESEIPLASFHSDKVESSQATSSCCDTSTEKTDWFLWGCLAITGIFYALAFADLNHNAWYGVISHSVHELINTMWWSVALAIFFVGILSRIPQEFIMSILGKGGTVKGLWRATLAGVLLDLCSHGILMVGMELRRKGASLGQVMAFLIASPWNSISLTLIMIALIGWGWTLSFIALSMVIALISGWIFDRFEKNGTLPANPVKSEIPEDFKFWKETNVRFSNVEWNRHLFSGLAKEGFNGSKMVIRWLLFGVLLASAIRGFVSLEDFQSYFGPSLMGLAATLLAATIIEVCSEGSTPIAADLMNRANAPGNSFAFLMTGVATDYTEVMVIKDSMKSWKIALFLPLITVPQVIVVALILNGL